METNEISEELKQLSAFEGNWKVRGQNLSGAPLFKNKPLEGYQKVDFLRGGKFLEAHWSYKFDKTNKHEGVTIIGKDKESSQFQTYQFDNGGYVRIYDLKIEGGLWNINGTHERSTFQFNNEGNEYHEIWEIRKGENWEPLCERFGEKL